MLIWELWVPTVDRCLRLERKETNQHNRNAFAVTLECGTASCWTCTIQSCSSTFTVFAKN